LLISKRHFQGPSGFDDTEASTLGERLRMCERIIEKVTKCDRVYTAALGSPKSPHFHAHMIPLYTSDHAGPVGKPPQPVTGTPFDVFLQEKLAADGALATADAAQVATVSEAFQREVSGQYP
jgi:diadenosine tetraphosphate (Ap4A) HIT family hydrolase